MQSPRVLVLLCTYNELQNLPQVLESLWHTLPEADVLVMDDNSPDGTGQWAQDFATREPRLHVVVRAGKLGLGSAVRDGIAWCLQRDYDYLMNFDADQSHDPRVANQLLAAVQNSPDGQLIAIGSRYVTGGKSDGLTWWRSWLSRTLNWYASRRLRLPILDCSGSYRCYPTALLRKIDLQKLQCTGYGFLEEILVHLRNAGARFTEVPITYHLRGGGHSKLRFSDAWGVLVVIQRLAK